MHPDDMERIFMLLRAFVAIVIFIFTVKCVTIIFKLISAYTD